MALARGSTGPSLRHSVQGLRRVRRRLSGSRACKVTNGLRRSPRPADRGKRAREHDLQVQASTELHYGHPRAMQVREGC